MSGSDTGAALWATGEEGRVACMQVVHYPSVLQLWHRLGGSPTPFHRAHQQAQRGEALTVHLAGVLRPTSSALDLVKQLPRSGAAP